MLPNLFRRHEIRKYESPFNSIQYTRSLNILECLANTVVGDFVPIHLKNSLERYYDGDVAKGPTFVFVTGSARRRALNVVSDIVCDLKVQKLLDCKTIQHLSMCIICHLVVLTDAILVFLFRVFHQLDQSLGRLCIIAQGDAILHLRKCIFFHQKF